MALDEGTKGRLYNWKFDAAKHRMEESEREHGTVPTEFERTVVTALSAMFGDSGWFWGSMGDVIRAAVGSLGVTFEEEEEPAT